MSPELNYLIPEFISKQVVTSDDFNILALKIFKYQFDHNLPYQYFCRSNSKTPRNVLSWSDIPPISINAFKDLSLSCVDINLCDRVFMTSGTTRQEIRGKHHHPNLNIYNLSMKSFFKEAFMNSDESVPMGILFPSDNELPNSSLAHYLKLAVEHFGADGSVHLMSNTGVHIEQFILFMQFAKSYGKPIALLGASYSFIHLFNSLKSRGLSTKFPLPRGSKILDTGGFKGQVDQMDLSDFYSILFANFEVPLSSCINMYGMTELSSQFYDLGQDSLPSIKKAPHWVKTRVINPITMKECDPGYEGLLVHCDLANINSVSTILTEDIGVMVNGGFQLLGRTKGVQARGCSLTVENIALSQHA